MMMTLRLSNRGLLIVFTTTLAFLVAVALAAVPAGAAVIHQKEGSFNGEGSPGGSFGGLLPGDAVDLATGDVYVAEEENSIFGLGHSRVDKFNREGAYAGVEITGSETPHGSFAFRLSFETFNAVVAVDNTAGANKGDLYVADTEHHVVDRFGQSGEFLCQIAGSETEAETPAAKECAGVKGSGLSATIAPASVAVDASGNVFVADDAHEAIDEFGLSGEFLSQIKDSHLSNEMTSIALDPGGALYVLSGNPFSTPNSTVLKLEGGHFVSVLDSKPSLGFAVDPTSGHVYVSDHIANEEGGVNEIGEYEPTGTLLDVTSAPGFHGLAVGPTGKLYVTESPLFSGGAVSIYSGDITVPTVATGVATSVTEATATVGATVDPDTLHVGGEVSECKFEYGPTEAYGRSAPCAGGAPFSGAVSANLTGLARSGVYHFRIEANNANGIASQGKDSTFTTAGPPVIDGAWARVSGTQVHLRAQINPFGIDTTCEFQYVDDAGFKHSRYASAVTVPCEPEDLGSGFGDRTARVTIDGLPVGTTYHYRFLATNRSGLTGVADQTFTTFGANSFGFSLLDQKGEPFTQAAGHPYELITSFKINQFQRAPDEFRNGSEVIEGVTVNITEGADGNIKDVISQLPAGLIGDPLATPRCTLQRVLERDCPGADQVGMITLDLEGENESSPEPMYNVVPSKGFAAEFAATVLGKVNLRIAAKLRSGEDYGVTAEAADASALAAVIHVKVKLWGVPTDASHDGQRRCGLTNCSLTTQERVLKPFLRMPTSCVGPLSTTLAVDLWQAPGEFSESAMGLPAITGCESVPFTPSLVVAPTTNAADSPSGLSFDLHLPQPDEPEGVAESDLKNTTVVFPAGLTVDPSSADGLAACSEAQVGFTAFAELNPSSEPGVRTPQFTPFPAQCPDASKLGTVEVDTRLVDHPLTGSIYLAKQGENPFGSLLAVYIAIYDPVTGVVVKLPGEVKADPITGQLTTTVDQNPQVPFEDFKIDLFEGPRAALTTPATCGTFTTNSVLTPWSGGAAVSPTSGFEVTSGAGGEACPATVAQEPNAPTFSAGTFSPIAGSYSPFVLHLGREDGSQTLSALSVTLPEGLLGRIAGTSECPQANIEAAQRRSGLGEGRLEQQSPSCPFLSEVGVVRVGVGSGAPFYVTGHEYLSGPYEGAPFSLDAVAPAVAGPFDLGVVVVRQGLYIDPVTARVTVKSDPFPTILDGIPLDLRSISVDITRSQFTLNPTSCEKMAVTGTLFAQSSQVALSSPFQVGGCNNLPFKPSFSASTQGKNSRPKGASLTVKLAQKPGEANIHKVDLALPIQLPSRLSTLKLACPAAQFESNPAGCPAVSNIGTGRASTPLLSVPFSGPAYLVSHGGAEFPDIEFVLQAVEQGGDIKIVLDGKTQIKNGVTYSHFETVPDAPISSFETVFPQGPYSILAANVAQSAKFSLCGQALRMGTTLTAQNGVVVNQSTKIRVIGCPPTRAKVKALTRAQKLTRALKACRKDRNKAKRAACVKAARKKFGPIKKKK